MAAMKVLPAPTETITNSPIFTPFFTARNWVRKLVDDPSPVTPRFLPLKSAGERTLSATFAETSSTSPGAWLNCTMDSTSFPLDCRSMEWS